MGNAVEEAKSTKRFRIMRWRRWLKPLISRNNSPEAIAGGTAIGFLVAFSPTLGVQLVIAYLIATLTKTSRAAALLPIWITTPFTAPPIYAFTYKIGRFFLPIRPERRDINERLAIIFNRIEEHEPLDLSARFKELFAVGNDIFIPLWIGGLIVGGLFAVVAYIVTREATRRWHARRAQRKHRRRHLLKFRLRKPDEETG